MMQDPFKNEIIRANTLVQQGRFDDACAYFYDIIAKDPAHVTALVGAGVAEALRGQNMSAVGMFMRALGIAPHDAQIWLNLGHAYLSTGQNKKALDTFEKATKECPEHPDILYWQAYLTEQKGKNEKAVELYQKLVGLVPTYRQAYPRLANLLYVQGKNSEALELLLKAEQQFAGDHEMTFLRGRLVSKLVAGWHLPMLDDAVRNDAYRKAIDATVKEGDVVLDIGTGSGLLAMMAARAGAAHVYACEANPVMVRIAREIVARNGFADKITVIGKHSGDMKVGRDMPAKADVLVTEIFDSAVVGEGVLTTLCAARADLLKPGARIVPESATLKACLVQCPQVSGSEHVTEICGFDLSPVNILSQPFAHKDARRFIDDAANSRIMSEDCVLEHFEFATLSQPSFEAQTGLKATTSGTVDSVMMWFDLQLARDISLCTRQFRGAHHWYPAMQGLPQACKCTQGQAYRLKTVFNGFFDFALQKA